MVVVWKWWCGGGAAVEEVVVVWRWWCGDGAVVVLVVGNCRGRGVGRGGCGGGVVVASW